MGKVLAMEGKGGDRAPVAEHWLIAVEERMSGVGKGVYHWACKEILRILNLLNKCKEKLRLERESLCLNRFTRSYSLFFLFKWNSKTTTSVWIKQISPRVLNTYTNLPPPQG